MAKKKADTTQKTETTKTKTEEINKAPEIEPGLINITFSPEDLRNFANLMSITAQTFENLALQAAQQNDEVTYQILAARHRMSSLYASKLAEHYQMGEPSSRDIH